MTTAEQFKKFGACVESRDGLVQLQVGREIVALTPKDAQHFTYYLAGAYLQAAGGRTTRNPEAVR